MKYILLFILLSFCAFLLKAQEVGLVLSGGGARGLSHIGAIKALEENNIPIDFITGTSSGALVGALYAMGYSPTQIEQIAVSSEFEDWATGTIDEEFTYYFKTPPPNASWITIKFNVDSTFQPNIPGNIINSSPMEFAMMEKMAPYMAISNNNFDSLFIPFRCVAADIVSNQSIVYSSGDLAKSLRASMAYPFYYKPVIDGNKILFDGGIYNNFPSDVMMEEFYPDMIIGVNVSSAVAPPEKDNIISQIKNMLQRPTNYSVICENGVLIEPDVEQYGLFSFTDKQKVIDEGYRAAMEQMELIKNFVYRRTDPETLNKQRQEFQSKLPSLHIDKIYVDGINSQQAQYVEKIIRPVNKIYSISELKNNYFKLLADGNIKSIYPVLKYNNSTGYFDLFLDVRREKDLVTEFGGNFSSRPINQAYIGVQYNLWGKQSLSLRANSYFGKLYSSVKVFPRLDITGSLPFYIEPQFTLNRWDYFKSSTAFFEDVKPSYLIQNENFAALQIGIPARNKGIVWAGLSYVHLDDRYYQTRDFLQADTADQTIFNALSGEIGFERNTLNRKMYASEGTYFSVKGKVVQGDEETTPGSTSVIKDVSKKTHSWLTLRVTYDNYFKRFGPLKFGLYVDNYFSNQPFFSNYTATILRATAFEPVQEMKTLLLDRFRAHNYVGGGLKTVISFSRYFDLRIEGYAFQPFQDIQQTQDFKPKYGEAFEKRYFIASPGLVYHSPVGPVSLSVNYYDQSEDPITVLFHFGYIIFNKRALE